jgi:hypothetical protein
LGIISEVSFETISSILNKLKLGLSLSGKERSQIIKIIGKAPTYSGTWTRYSNLIKSIKFGYELSSFELFLINGILISFLNINKLSNFSEKKIQIHIIFMIRIL